MAAITTLSSSAVVAFLLAMVLSAHASPLVECPRVHTDGRKNGALTGADLYQGPPQKKASMIPDLETWVWDLDGYQQNALERGDSLFLVCHYHGVKADVTIEVPRVATYCKVDVSARGTTAFCGSGPATPQRNADVRPR
jgi:hypothetical protein